MVSAEPRQTKTDPISNGMAEERKVPIRLSCHSGDCSKTGNTLKITELIVDATTINPAIAITCENLIRKREILLDYVGITFSVS